MILGICGLAGSGKDTAAKFIIEDYSFVQVAFADEMKRICKRVYDFTDEQLWGPSEFRNAPDKRYLRPAHTWTKLPGRERRLTDAEKVEFPDAKKYIEDNWYGCACCGLETRSTPTEDGSSLIRHPEKCYLTPRYALQMLGTEWGRDCYLNTWVDLTIRQARLLLGLDKGTEPSGYWYDQKRGLLSNLKTNHIPDFVAGVIVTDVRHINEIHAIKAAGGKVVRVIRRGSGLSGGAALHSSETEHAALPDSDFDAIIVNDETLGALHDRTRLALSMLGVKC